MELTWNIVIQNQYWTLRFALRMSNVMINAHNHWQSELLPFNPLDTDF